mmetsp:Transcript_12385/g.20523  ORF Transcript_12385/g.20523 Transcript_12385/m.20523 type:complete len:290 (-) Transcript_12385:155-1024(-)
MSFVYFRHSDTFFFPTASISRNQSTSTSLNMLTVHQFPCLSDNYGFLIHDEVTGQTAAIDTPCGKTYKEELEKKGWKLTHILNTHHHHDHVGGNDELKKTGDNVKVYGPVDEKDKIPGLDTAVGGGDCFEFGPLKASVMDVGGHTHGHIAYHFDSEKKVFCGDALFALGCGKMFEGTPAQFWKTLQGLRELPDETEVYCAHEYTASNAKFAVSIEPSNADLMKRFEVIKEQRARGEPTVPTQIGLEKLTNPFLRVDISEEIRKNVGVTAGDSGADAFAKVRRAKDTFRG